VKNCGTSGSSTSLPGRLVALFHVVEIVASHATDVAHRPRDRREQGDLARRQQRLRRRLAEETLHGGDRGRAAAQYLHHGRQIGALARRARGRGEIEHAFAVEPQSRARVVTVPAREADQSQMKSPRRRARITPRPL
jgi:hypothetical protein